MGKYVVYIIQSESSGRYYVGCTSNLRQRLASHNTGMVTSTRKRGPWSIVYTEDFFSKERALLREKQIKSYKGGEAFKKLVKRSVA